MQLTDIVVERITFELYIFVISNVGSSEAHVLRMNFFGNGAVASLASQTQSILRL